jgi:hypothetical protein
MNEALTLMIVHAHPDDEVIGSGGTLAHYGDGGIRYPLHNRWARASGDNHIH